MKTRSIRSRAACAFALLLALVLSGCASSPARKYYPASDALLPGTEPEMNAPGFWISRHPAPDALILDDSGIAELNAQIREKKLARDLATWAPPAADELSKDIEGAFRWVASLKVYERSGRRVGKAFLDPLGKTVSLGGKFAQVRFGFLARKTDLRALPTDAPLFDGPGDPAIDNLQASSLEAGTPLVIQATTGDGTWLYVTGERASGWVREDRVAFASREAFLDRYLKPGKLTVIAAKAELWENPERTRLSCSVRMGSRLVPAEAPAETTGDGSRVSATQDRPSTVVPVLVADRDPEGNLYERTLWASRADVVEGFLPFTARSVYVEAFKLLNAPYGWGGSFGEQDCSQFLCEVFSTVGLTLPRNSSKQAKAGIPVRGFPETGREDASARESLLSGSAIPGATLLRLPGHIMLYLGSINGKPYAIHATFAYREKGAFRERIRLINRVVVSTLDLGKGTSVGSHLERLTDATVLGIEPRICPETEQGITLRQEVAR
jgi:hypothetical protein